MNIVDRIQKIKTQSVGATGVSVFLRLLGLPTAELLTQWVYAKKFYPMVVHAALNQLLGQMTEKDRRLKLLRHMAQIAVPADLAPLWLAMKV